MRNLINLLFTKKTALFVLFHLLIAVFTAAMGSLLFNDFQYIELKDPFFFSFAQLKEYYPNYYWLIFGVTRLLKYGIPLLFIYFGYTFRLKLKSLLRVFSYANERYWWNLHVTILTVGLVTFLFLYYLNFTDQLFLSNLFIGSQLIFHLIILLPNRRFLAKEFKAFLLEPILPYSLSITRILFFSYSLFLYAIVFPLAYGNGLDGLTKQSLPGITWLINILPVNNNLYLFFCYAGVLISFFIVIGFKTRFFLILNFFIVFYVTATPNFFGKLWHQQIFIWIAWILAFSDCFDVLSVDSKLSKKELKASAKYGFHLKIIWLHFGIIYFFAGFYKLWVAGFDWALSQSMINQVQLEWFENYQKVPSLRLDKLPNLLKILGFSAILFELSYIFFLFSKKTRWFSILGGLIMHTSISYLMHISFLVFLQAFYIVFIPWNKLLSKLKLIKLNYAVDQSPFYLKKLVYLIPVFILSANLMYSVFRIDSYPFSVYPGYTDIVPSTFKFLSYKIIDKDKKNLNLWEEAKATHFRWESFSRFEPAIVEKYQTENVIDSFAIEQQWMRWKLGVPSLQSVKQVEVYALELFLEPEKQQDTILKQYLYTLQISENQ